MNLADILIKPLGLVLLGMMFAPIAMAKTGEPPNGAAAQRGQPLFEKYCASCHGVRGVGERPVPWSLQRPDYFTAPALDDSQHAWHHRDEDLVKTILNGSPRTKRMPAWKNTISEQDAADIANYVKSLWGPRAIACQGPKHMSCKLPPGQKK